MKYNLYKVFIRIYDWEEGDGRPSFSYSLHPKLYLHSLDETHLKEKINRIKDLDSYALISKELDFNVSEFLIHHRIAELLK